MGDTTTTGGGVLGALFGFGNEYSVTERGPGDIRSFKVDPIRHSGLLENQAKSCMYALALAKPERYKTIRASVEQKLTFDLTQLIFETVYKALNEGKDMDGKPLVDLSDKTFEAYRQPNVKNNTVFQPFIREEEINEIAFSIASTLINDLKSKVINRIVPTDLKDLADERIASRTAVKVAAGKLDPNE